MTEVSESNKAGDIVIERIDITSNDNVTYDLQSYMIEFRLVEDMFGQVMSGDILMADATNAIGNFPIIGGEVITIKFRSPIFDDDPDNIIEKCFQVYAITDRSVLNDREQRYVLHFMSLEGTTDASKPLSQRFTGYTHDMVNDIYIDYMKEKRVLTGKKFSDLIIGDTPHSSEINYISNFWTPIQNLNYIAKYCNGAEFRGSDYVFFESNKNFFFTSIQNLIKKQEDAIFDQYRYDAPGITSPTTRSVEYNFAGADLDPKFTQISDIKLPRTIDILDGQQSGYYSQAARAYDLFTKERVEAYIDIRDSFGDFVHTDPGIPIPAGIQRHPMSRTSVKILNSFAYVKPMSIPGGKAKSTNEAVVYNTLYRDNYLNSFKDYTFEITVPGRTDIAVGNLIVIKFPATGDKSADTTADEIHDKLISGKFLITAIKHVITLETHVMIMEVVKNGLAIHAGPADDGVLEDI